MRILGITALLIFCWLLYPAKSPANTYIGPVTASYYGPGLYGNHTACGLTLSPLTRGVAHRSLPCGARLTLRTWNGTRFRLVRTRVIDRGPFIPGRTFDLTLITARDLCQCKQPPGLTRLYYRRGWFY